jgi:hypothetical protein
MTDLQAALIEALKDLDDPKKNRTGTHGAQYLDLSALLTHAKTALGAHGLAVTQHVSVTEDGLEVLTELLHTSGEAKMYGPARVRAAGDMQQLGGQITYLRRYQLAAALGVAGAHDDDGQQLKGEPVEPEPRAKKSRAGDAYPMSDKQKRLLGKLTREAGYDDSRAFMASELFYETLGLENQDSPQQTINTIEADKLIKALNRVIGEATDE